MGWFIKTKTQIGQFLVDIGYFDDSTMAGGEWLIIVSQVYTILSILIEDSYH